MVTGSSISEENRIRGEIRSIVEGLELLTQRLRELHSWIPIPPGDDLMLVGEAEPVFEHVVRVFIECALADHLEPLGRDLQGILVGSFVNAGSGLDESDRWGTCASS